MSPEQRIEEAHGIWELTVTHVTALAAAVSVLHPNAPSELNNHLRVAVNAEREAFHHWKRISTEITGGGRS